MRLRRPFCGRGGLCGTGGRKSGRRRLWPAVPGGLILYGLVLGGVLPALAGSPPSSSPLSSPAPPGSWRDAGDSAGKANSGETGTGAANRGANGEPDSLVDQRGRPLPPLPGPAQRVITFNSVLWLYLTIEGSADPLAGASTSTIRTVTSGLLGQVFPGAGRIADDVAADGFFVPNVEAILRRSPDVLFQWAGRNDPAYLEPLERAGLPVIGLRQTTGEDDYFSTARMVGAVSGRAGRAEALIARYQESYARLDRDVAAALEARETGGQRQRVLYLWKSRPLIPIDGRNFFSTLLTRSGGDNVAAALDRPRRVGMEQILAWDPEVILLFCCDRTLPEDLYRDPLWQPVSAVRHRRVFKVPSGGSRFADLVEGPLFSRWLAELLFPQQMAPRLREEMRQTFRDVYGVELDDATLDRTLHVAANAGLGGRMDPVRREAARDSARTGGAVTGGTGSGGAGPVPGPP